MTSHCASAVDTVSRLLRKPKLLTLTDSFHEGLMQPLSSSTSITFNGLWNASSTQSMICITRCEGHCLSAERRSTSLGAIDVNAHWASSQDGPAPSNLFVISHLFISMSSTINCARSFILLTLRLMNSTASDFAKTLRQNIYIYIYIIYKCDCATFNVRSQTGG